MTRGRETACSKAEAIVIGGGIAGLQASIQLSRYRHVTICFDKGYARSHRCKQYRNILGYPDGVSGQSLREAGRQQLQGSSVEIRAERVTDLSMTGTQEEPGFRLQTDQGRTYTARVVLLSAGVEDRLPSITGLPDCLGLSVYICPDCDGYEVFEQPAAVIGTGQAAIHMLQELVSYTDELVWIVQEPFTQPLTSAQQAWLCSAPVRVYHSPVTDISHEEGHMQALRLGNGEVIRISKAFLAMGGNQVNTRLARQVGAKSMDNLHLYTESRTKMTSIPGLWAAGDVGYHSEQLVIAMGEGAQAAIWMHRWLMGKRPPSKSE
ncbi:NAD(P)/FAD-dependent oxidoreductase [Marinicrinis sediminis]|uniref:NAD(P)/FAD-dependent oxidoreductase n=1 Tax=Marinicrinis sediminis TaxID=1652465 RepID=A0ABW5RBA8_9BACL